MSSLSAALRQETAFVSSAQPQHSSTLAPPWASQSNAAPALYDLTLQSVGGAVFLQDCVRGAQPERGLHWQIENSAGGVLHLTEFTVHGGACGPRTTVEAAFRLFPALAATGTPDGRLLLAALLSNGYLMHTALHCSPSPSSSPASTGAVLSSLTPDALRPLDLSQHLAALGTPTSLCATPEALLVGGSNGSVLCVPLACLEDGNTGRAFELRDSSWALTKLIPGVLYRQRQPAALAAVPVSLGPRQLLLVAYDDCMLRVFNVGRRQQLATMELETPGVGGAAAAGGGGGGSRQIKPIYVAAEGPAAPEAAATAAAAAAGTAGVTLVAQFEGADSRRYTYAYTLSAGAGGRLSLAGATPLEVEAGGLVAEARVSGDTVWLLIKTQGRAKVLGYSRSAGTVVSSAVLAEAAGEHVGAAVAASGNGPEVDQELWEWLLSAFPGELSAEGQVCQQVLVPGQTCRASLRDALSYHGAQLSGAEVDAAPPGVLRGWMQAAVMAIQRRTPTASPAECWQSFLATYRAAGARRHPPLGLVLHPASPHWLGLARGGSVLAVLRRGSTAEALQGGDAAGAGGGALELPAHLEPVHRCAAEAGALLGPLAGEACLALLAAGVDPLERLLPRLCELWFGGPAGPAAAAAAGGLGSVGGGRAAALTDSAREAQQRWRQRRQQLIISMGQRLGGLANPVASVQSYLGLLRLLSAQAAAELAAGAAGGGAAAGVAAPSRAASSFLVATCRQVSRAAAAAVRDAALLLGLLVWQCGLGCGAGAGLDRAALSRLEAALLPEACDLLRRAALGLWLTGTPSSQDEATDMEPALSALRHLRLGPSSPAKRSHAEGPGAPTATGGPQPSGAAAPATAAAAASGDVSLAARLLPGFCAAYAGGRGGRLDLLTGAEAAGLLFTLYLQYGEQPSASMAARVLQLGYQLFQAGEYGNLAELAALAGATGASEAGPQFLRGLGITCALALERQQQQQQQQQQGVRQQLPGGAGGGAAGAARRAELIGEAAGCFFRAAASLASEAGDTLRGILRDLRSELSGAGRHAEAAGGGDGGGGRALASAAAAARPPARREVALLQLHFCEAVMQLFEREGAPEGAVMFASAALEHLRAAYGHPADGSVAPAAARGGAGSAADADAALLPGEERVLAAAAAAAEAERRGREGRLWSNIYSYCVDLRQFERAYAALLSNPLPAARLQSLRHLVHVLAQEGQLQTLCTLPFAGVAVLAPAEASAAGASGGGAAGPAAGAVAPGPRTVSLLSEALELLHRRAHNCDLAESPQPYQVLYDFLICRCDYKGAARAMAAYAWRLRAEAPGTEAAVAEALRAYDLAINCLSLLDPADAWLDLTDPWVEKLAPHSHSAAAPALPGVLASAPGSGVGATAGAGLAAGGALAASRGGPSAVAAAAAAAPVATVQSLQRERTMLHFCALVAARVPGLEPMRQWDNEDAILRQLLLMGRYEGALALVADCYGGPGSDPWVRAMEAVVGALAAHCTRLQLQDGGVPTGGAPLPPTDLFNDEPDGGAATAGLGAAAVASTLGGRAAPLWGKLRQLLSQVAAAEQQSAAAAGGGGGAGGSVSVAWMLRDAAAEAVLRTDPRVDLPQWLLDLFLAPDSDLATGAATPAAMGSAACGPASLLGAYLRHDRLAAAVELVAAAVERWGRVDVRLRRQHGAAWMPYPQLALLHTKLSIAQQLGQERSAALAQQLNAALAAHLELVATDTERLELRRPTGQQAPGAPAGAAVDLTAAVAPPLLLLGAGDSVMGTPMTPLGAAPAFAGAAGGGIRLFG